jgi:hypothetical protein
MSSSGKCEKREEGEETVNLYANILKEIRDMNVLSSYQIHYLRCLPSDKLIRIIEVYNKIVSNVNEIL